MSYSCPELAVLSCTQRNELPSTNIVLHIHKLIVVVAACSVSVTWFGLECVESEL